MAEEQYVNIIAQTFANLGHSTCSMATVMAELSNNHITQESLLDHLHNGGEIGSDIQIPRTMLPEFNKRCMEANIKFQACERDIQSEFVTIMYKGPMSHKVNDIGDFERTTDGTRAELQSDTKRIKAIAAEINTEYIEKSAKEYIQPNPANRKTFENAWVATGLDKDMAILMQEQLADHFVECNIYYDEEKNDYAVEFDAENAKRLTPEHFSSAEMSLREAFIVSNDDSVTEYVEDQKLLNSQLLAKIETGELKGVLYEPKLVVKKDTKELMDARELVIKFNGRYADVSIKDPLHGDYINEQLDLSKENDRLRLYKDMGMMKGKAFVSSKEYEDIEKMHKLNYEEEIDDFELTLIKDDYEKAKFESSIKDFENMAIEKAGSVEAFREEDPNHYAWKEYDKNIAILNHAFGYDEKLYDDKKNFIGLKHHDGVKDKYFTRADLEFTEYMSARTLDPRIAMATEQNAIENEQKEKGKNRDNDVSIQMRIENSDVIVNHVAVLTKNDAEAVESTDKQRFEEIKRKSDERLTHMNVVMGRREDIIGDTHSYDKPVSLSSLTAQEFALKHESYYEKDLDKEYESHMTTTKEEWDYLLDNAEQYDRDLNGDGEIDEADYDPFGGDEEDEDRDEDHDGAQYFDWDDDESFERTR